MNGVSLSKKDDQIYFTFPETKQELSVSTAVGLLFLYEFYCMLRQEGTVVDSFFSVMMRDYTAHLAQLKPIYAVRGLAFVSIQVPHFFQNPDIQRLQAVQASLHIPESSFVLRSLPCVLHCFYSSWKKAYESNKEVKKCYVALDFGETSSHIYLLRTNRVLFPPPFHLASLEDRLPSAFIGCLAPRDRRRLRRGGQGDVAGGDAAVQHDVWPRGAAEVVDEVDVEAVREVEPAGGNNRGNHAGHWRDEGVQSDGDARELPEGAGAVEGAGRVL